MPCYKPLQGWLAIKPNPDTGKRAVVFKWREGFYDVKMQVPCGKCVGCREERAKYWAIRCVHEASLYEKNCFITLTFDDKNLNVNGSLVKSDFQKFIKRLRKHFGSGVRYFHCGEYGEKLSRPHHHACLFNFDFDDKYLWSVRNGVRLYRSKTLEELWPFGFCTIGEVSFASAAYVARYCLKKVTGVGADKYYNGKVPEYVTMSRRPGIASVWLDKFKSDVYPHDYLVLANGVKCKPPRFYDEKFSLTNEVDFDNISMLRRQRAFKNPENSNERLYTKNIVAEHNLKERSRSYETNGV